jgi:hypothetical protein
MDGNGRVWIPTSCRFCTYVGLRSWRKTLDVRNLEVYLLSRWSRTLNFRRAELEYRRQAEGVDDSTQSKHTRKPQLPFSIVYRTSSFRRAEAVVKAKPRLHDTTRRHPLPNIGEASCISRPAIYRHKVKFTYTYVRMREEAR